MSSLHTLVFCVFLQTSTSTYLDFPSNFKFGASTSSYQIEGGWNADGKGENVWDKLIHENRTKIKNNENGDVAADSYHLWKEDIRLTTEMGLQFYRFSINWPRILPNGFPNKINKAGVKYYSDLIDGLLAAGVEPVITLYHWEMPTKIFELGGWANPLTVKWFGDYARIVFSLFADRVKTWTTINEAIVICDCFYNTGMFLTIKEDIFGAFLCNKHVLMAHATAYRIYDQEFRSQFGGRVSLSNNILWIEPFGPKNEELAELGREHNIGRYSHPIFSKEGGWPPAIEKALLKYSLIQGFNESRLPQFTEEEKAFVKGTADYYAINYYTSYMIRQAKLGEDPGYWFITGSPELYAVLEKPKDAWYGASSIMPVRPEGLRRIMSWVKKRYGDLDFLITECGFSTLGYQLVDDDRIKFFKDHLEQVLLSIKVDNISVIGFSAWSLLDNFEWLDGYDHKFGLYEVNFEDPKRTRTPRKSAHYYSCVAKNKSLNVTNSCIDKSYYIHRDGRNNIQNGGSAANIPYILIALSLIVNLVRSWHYILVLPLHKLHLTIVHINLF